ncbi:Hypothetical predicted protein, partial [Marmota monax]
SHCLAGGLSLGLTSKVTSLVAAAEREVSYQSTANCRLPPLLLPLILLLPAWDLLEVLFLGASATEETAALDANEAHAAAYPRRSPGDTAPTAVAPAGLLPTANNQHYHRELLQGRLQVWLHVFCTHFGTPARAWGLSASRFTTTRASGDSSWDLQVQCGGAC